VWIEAEKVAGVAVHAVDHILFRVPDHLSPVVAHMAGRRRIVQSEIVFFMSSPSTVSIASRS